MGSQNSGSPQDNRTDRGTILVVDDSPTIRKLVDIILKKRGFRVISASNGLEALARINDGLPSMIFLDITMPRMDGYQLCKIIKANRETRDIPVVMLTSKDGLIDKVRGRMAGSTGYITKPFGPDTLLQAVEKYSNSKDN
jgi:twitching motility two-component system response regulator PilG